MVNGPAPSPGAKLVAKSLRHKKLVVTVQRRVLHTRRSFWDPVDLKKSWTKKAKTAMMSFNKLRVSCSTRTTRWEQRAAINMLRRLNIFFGTWPQSCSQHTGRTGWRVVEMVIASMLTQQTNDAVSLNA